MVFRTEVRRLILLIEVTTRSWKCAQPWGSLAPLVGASPGVGRATSLASRSRLRRPVRGLGLCGPVVGHLEGRCSSRSSLAGGARSSVSGPVGDRRGGAGELLTSPLLLGRGSHEVRLLAGHHLLGSGGLLLLSLLRVAVEEQVGHHLPGHVARDGAAQPEHLPGKEPPHEADALGALVVAGHGDVDELGGRVHVAERHDGDVGVGSLSDGLMVAPGVGDEKEPGLPEGSLDLVSEGSGGEAASDGGAANVPGKLEDSTLGIWAAGDHIDVLWVLNSSNGPGGKNQLLPGLLQVDDVDTIGLLLEDVLLHRSLAVIRTDVGGGSQHLSDVILGYSKGRKSSRHCEQAFLNCSYEARCSQCHMECRKSNLKRPVHNVWRTFCS